MNKLYLISLSIGCLLLVAGIILINNHFEILQSNRFEISNMQIEYGTYPLINLQTLSSPEKYLTFELRNLYNTDLRTVGFKIDNIDLGQYPIRTQPGQTTSEELPIEDIAISSSTNYQIHLTFTFANGKYETYSTNYRTPQFKGEVEITKLSYIWSRPNLIYIGNFQIEIKNTGNIPVSDIDCTFGDKDIWLFYPSHQVNMGETALSAFEERSFSDPEIGVNYPVVIKLNFLDGSQKTIYSSVISEANY